PAATLALLVGVVLPLFLATQVGSAVAMSRNHDAAAQVIGLEVLTGAACWFGALIGWLVLPAAISAGGNTLVNGAAAAFVPLLFTWLWAVSLPSPESRSLVRHRVANGYARLVRLCGEFETVLGSTDGRTLGRPGSRGALWRSAAARASAAACVPGVLFATHRIVLSGLGALPRAMCDVALMVAAFTLVHLGSLAEFVGRQAVRLIDGRWSAFGQGLAVFSFLSLMAIAGASAAASGNWRGAFAIWTVFLGPLVLRRVQRRTRVQQALVYRSVRVRGVSILRSCRLADPRVAIADIRAELV
ncbi:MAG: hypothetical protein HGA44_21025, partial [Cellulomonadaceae bacterium]|nr:hypothetical protein [Cellulomonadaceae bacterium]